MNVCSAHTRHQPMQLMDLQHQTGASSSDDLLTFGQMSIFANSQLLLTKIQVSVIHTAATLCPAKALIARSAVVGV